MLGKYFSVKVIHNEVSVEGTNMEGKGKLKDK
jgi:hypothetical protein